MSSYKLDKALDQTPSGNIEKYFNFVEMQLQENDGRSDNKCLSIDAYDPPCPVAKGMYTKLKLTDESINIVNIDKSSITAVVRINVAGASTTLNAAFFNSYINTSGTPTKDCELASKLIKDASMKLNKVFVGFKSAIHVLDAYRIYSNGKKTLCEQTEALFENAACRMIKCQEELDEKPGIYTTWRHAYMYEEQVCGTYINIYDLIQGVQTVEFELTIPIDEFLPFQAMTLFPNCIFGNLQVELKMAIQNNFVCCQVSNYESSVEAIRSLLISQSDQSNTGIPAACNLYTKLSKNLDNAIKKSFTQCGDKFDVAFIAQLNHITMEDNTTTYSVIDEHCTMTALENSYFIQWFDFVIEITAGQLMSCRTNLNGFNIRDDVIDKLYNKFSNEPLVIPAQFIDYQAFSQPPMSFGLKCNTTYNLTNCSSILFLFPRTNHEVTCSRNPFLGSIQVQIDNKPYPDKPFSTHEAAHTIYNLTNIGFDSIFSTSEEYSYSLTWDEISAPITLATNTIREKESEDNTSYCFVCSTERLSGFGTFCDGLNKDNAHITLTGTLSSLPAGITYHPYYQPDGNINNRPPIMLICQDCFWKCTPDGGVEFIINDKNFYKELTESKRSD